MASVPDEETILSSAKSLIDAGIAVHLLKRRDKAPVELGWTTAPVHTFKSLKAAYRAGNNLGVRPGKFSKTALGYLHIFDIDVRDAAQLDDALAVLDDLAPGWRKFPFAWSGSGGESRHVYFFCDEAFGSKTLAHSRGFENVFDAKKDRDVKKYDWEVALFGSMKQAVLPPSVHPDSGLPYEWGREFDFDAMEDGHGPVISAEDVRAWGVSVGNMNDGDDEDDITSFVKAQPMDLDDEEIDDILADLPEDWVDDRDQWVQVGMALSHQYEGSEEGYKKWVKWSKQSEKYDPRDQKDKWKSFKGRNKPVRMATLIKFAGLARAQREQGDLEEMFDDDDSDDLDLDAARGGKKSRALTVIPHDVDEDDDLDLNAALGRPSVTAQVKNVEVFDPNWQSYLAMNEEATAYKPCAPNVELIVRNDPRTRGIIALNKFTSEIVQIAEPPKYQLRKKSPKPVRQLDGLTWILNDKLNGKLWTDSHDHALRIVLEAPKRQGGYDLKTTDRDLRASVDIVAAKNAFHPVHDYLESLTWDRKPRVEKLFIKYVGAEDNAYHRETAMLFMMAAVTRVYEPGHKFDFVPILEGLQGRRKSTFIRILGRSWFSELHGDFNDKKEMVENMQGSWILEIPELSSFNRSEVNTIKAFVSGQFDKVRLSYERRARSYERQCVFMGSTNDKEYLRDQTGGRRFWPIECTVTEIDTDMLARNIDQLWAEAYAMYCEWRRRHPHGDLPLYLRNEDSQAMATSVQESRRAETPEDGIAGTIEHWLNKPVHQFEENDGEEHEPEYRDEVCLIQLWVEMLGRDRSQYDMKNQQQLARAMAKVKGWDQVGQQRTDRFGKQRLYRRVKRQK